MPTAKSGGRKFRNDIIFISVLLAVVVLMGVAFFLLRGEGDTVTVEVNGVRLGSYPLSEDRTVEIRTGIEDEELNLLVIKDGKAFVETATCPDGICAAHRPISREGESIVCLPHKVVITISSAKGNAPDIVA
ncbi:MAG: NusG domain II-containing protein [Clostridia bacterium]|nr:NusG domain II-containing protein [Clostridia bacterium]